MGVAKGSMSAFCQVSPNIQILTFASGYTNKVGILQRVIRQDRVRDSRVSQTLNWKLCIKKCSIDDEEIMLRKEKCHGQMKAADQNIRLEPLSSHL